MKPFLASFFGVTDGKIRVMDIIEECIILATVKLYLWPTRFLGREANVTLISQTLLIIPGNIYYCLSFDDPFLHEIM